METLINSHNISEESSNNDKPRKRRQRKALPSLPSVASGTDMTDVEYRCKVDTTPITWEQLPIYSMFSLSPDGSFPQVKISKSRRFELRTANSFPCGSGRCYRVMF